MKWAKDNFLVERIHIQDAKIHVDLQVIHLENVSGLLDVFYRYSTFSYPED